MIPQIADAQYAGGYRVRLRFADGFEGVIELEEELWGEIFEP